MTEHSWHEIPSGALTARDVSQVLREVVLGRRTMIKIGSQFMKPLYASHVQVDVEGWLIAIYNDGDEPDYCASCESPDGQRWEFDPGSRADPVALLSTWEHQTLQRMLKGL
ncbi:hypothetical protein MD26_12485 [Pseudomonas sp. H2]|nr:hypothetical protein MD26_12485 [Pseudomonas sp. H2]MUT49759.1 hypothetical protein [Pseudomonas sp. TDA1]